MNIATRCRRHKKINTKNGAWSDRSASRRILTSSTLRATRLFGHGRRRCLRTRPYDTASPAPKHQRSLATRAPPTMGCAARPSAAPTKMGGGSCSKHPALPRDTVERLPRQRFGRTKLEPKLPRARLNDLSLSLSLSLSELRCDDAVASHAPMTPCKFPVTWIPNPPQPR